MAIETDALVGSLATTREPMIPALWAALMQPLMVQFGSIPKFYMNNLRYKAHVRRTVILHTCISVVLFIGACIAFGFTTANVVDYIGPINNDTYPDETDAAEATALTLLAYVQIGYPLVAAVDFGWMWYYGTYKGDYQFNEYSPWLSTGKDILYASLDVSTKAGLCLVAFLRATGY